MNENEIRSIEKYERKFAEDPASFNDYEANDFIKLLKSSNNNERAIEIGRTFISAAPSLKMYKNQYGYALYNKFINIDDDKIEANEELFFSVLNDILDVCKQERYSPVEAAVNRAIKYLTNKTKVDHDKVLELYDLLDVNLISDKPFTSDEGKEFESKKERHYRLKVKELYEAKRYADCVEFANQALANITKFHFNNAQWVNYYRACALVELGQNEEAKGIFLELNNRIRGINFLEIIARNEKELGNVKVANAYTIYEFFLSGFKESLMPLYNRVLEMAKAAGVDAVVNATDKFLQVLAKESQKEYTPVNVVETDKTASQLYDDLYNSLMDNIEKFVDRHEGNVLHYNAANKYGSISYPNGESVFFRQSDFIEDEQVRRRDRVSYTLIETYDHKKDRLSSRAILIESIEPDFNFEF